MRKQFELAIAPIALLFLVLVTACQSVSPPPTTRAPSPSPTVEVSGEEWILPSDYSLYSDSSGLFEISYPPEWEINPTCIPDMMLSTEKLMETMQKGDQLEEAGVILCWGKPAGSGYHPACNIVVEPRPLIYQTVEELTSAQISTIKNMAEEFSELSRQATTNDGREAEVLEYEAAYSGIEGKQRTVVTFMIVGDTAWTIGCSLMIQKSDFADFEDHFNNIVRSITIND